MDFAEEGGSSGGGGGGGGGLFTVDASVLVDHPDAYVGVQNRQYGFRFSVKAEASPITVVGFRLATVPQADVRVSLWDTATEARLRDVTIPAGSLDWTTAGVDPYELTPGASYDVTGYFHTEMRVLPFVPLAEWVAEDVTYTTACAANQLAVDVYPAATFADRTYGFVDFVR